MSIKVFNNFINEKNILINVHILNDGLGDAAIAEKVATVIKNLGVSKERIFFTTNDPDKLSIFTKKEYKILNQEEEEVPKRSVFIRRAPNILNEEELSKAIKAHNIGLQIHVSVSFLADVLHTLPNNLPSLALHEFGNPNESLPEPFQDRIHTKSMGFNEKVGEVGIPIDKEMKEWAFSEEARDPLKRMQKLEKLSPALQKAILGPTPDSENFVKTHALYLAYPKNEEFIKAFVLTIAQLNVENAKHMMIVLPGSRDISEFQDTNWINKISSLGISSLPLQCYDKESGTVKELILHQKEGDKKLTIITGSMNHEDVRLLSMASEKETVVAGDGSMVDAISGNKAFLSETRMHKKKAAQALTDLYRKIKGSYGRESITLEGENSRLKSSEISEKMSSFFQTNQKNHYEDITRLNQEICDKFDLANQLPLLIEKVLSSPLVPLVDLKSKKIVDYNQEILFDTDLLVTLSQMSELQISSSTGRSMRSDLQDSSFGTHALGNGSYLLKRVRKI